MADPTSPDEVVHFTATTPISSAAVPLIVRLAAVVDTTLVAGAEIRNVGALRSTAGGPAGAGVGGTAGGGCGFGLEVGLGAGGGVGDAAVVPAGPYSSWIPAISSEVSPYAKR